MAIAASLSCSFSQEGGNVRWPAAAVAALCAIVLCSACVTCFHAAYRLDAAAGGSNSEQMLLERDADHIPHVGYHGRQKEITSRKRKAPMIFPWATVWSEVEMNRKR